MLAQTRHESRLESGVAWIEQPGSTTRTALILGGLRHSGDSTMARLFGGSITWARDSVAAAQALAAFAWRPSPLSSWQVEGGASGSAFALSEIGTAGNLAGWLRGRRAATRSLGLMTGASVGHTIRRSGDAPSVTFEAGAWTVTGPLRLEVTAARTRTEDSLLMAASRVFTVRPSTWLDVDDIAVSATVARGPLELSASQRWRRGLRGTATAQRAFVAAATWAVTPGVGLVVSAGRQLADPVRGAPDAQIATALLRFTFASSEEPAGPPASALRVDQVDEQRTLIVRIRAPLSARVEVAGSFSNWDPVPLVRKGGYWEAQVRVAPGRYRVAYRVDGGAWRAPQGPSVARIREFGGEVALIVIP